MKSYAFLFWGYLVVWAGLTMYFVFLGTKIASLSRRLNALEARDKPGNPRPTT